MQGGHYGAQRGKEMFCQGPQSVGGLSELGRPAEEEAKEMADRGRNLALWALTKTWILF